jgi:hypothetical protein
MVNRSQRDRRRKGSVTGECRLCGRTTTLCKSHIIPESMYRPLYDDKSRATVINSEDRIRRPVQQGLKEPLFCLDCEGKFNRLETPFVRFWKTPNRFPSMLDRTLAVRVDGVDYDNTTKVLLSILWRAHVADAPALSAVRLGPHANKIRAIFMAETRVSPDDYPIFGFVLRDRSTGGVDRRLVLTPARTKTDGQWNYLMAFFGCLWKVFVSRQSAPMPQRFALKPDDTILMPVIDRSAVPHIQRLDVRSQ